MIHCEGEGCTKREQCQRYAQRKGVDLVSRVLCRGGMFTWFVKVEK